MPSAHQPLSKSAPPSQEQSNQQLLDEALAEQRAENKKQLDALLADKDRFKETESGCRLSLPPGDVEWLLQVLNDIRVGSWLRLGSPEATLELATLSNLTAPDFFAMELAGHFSNAPARGPGGRGSRNPNFLSLLTTGIIGDGHRYHRPALAFSRSSPGRCGRPGCHRR